MANLSVAGYTVYGSLVLETEGGMRLYLNLPLGLEYAEAINEYLKDHGEPPMKQLKGGRKAGILKND